LPKPYLFKRASGAFVRFLIPADLRPAFQRDFLVRRLFETEPDAQRLAAARMGAALCAWFVRLRRGEAMDKDAFLKSLAAKARRGETSDLIIGQAVGRDGTQYTNVRIDTPADAALFRQLTQGAATVHIPGLETTLALPALSAPPMSTSPLLSTAINDYKRERDGKRDPRGELNVANILSVFLALTGDIRIHLVQRQHVLDFEDAIKLWPSNARKRKAFKDLSVADILKLVKRNVRSGDADYDRLSDRSREKYRDTLAAFFNYLENTNQLFKAPTKRGLRQGEHRIRKAQERRPFTDDELKCVFDPVTYAQWSAGKPHHFWGPWLALYSGGRVNEVAQLYVDDIETIHGVAGFRVRNARNDQHIKTKSSIPRLPAAMALALFSQSVCLSAVDSPAYAI
jgi:hypothetical protein